MIKIQQRPKNTQLTDCTVDAEIPNDVGSDNNYQNRNRCPRGDNHVHDVTNVNPSNSRVDNENDGTSTPCGIDFIETTNSGFFQSQDEQENEEREINQDEEASEKELEQRTVEEIDEYEPEEKQEESTDDDDEGDSIVNVNESSKEELVNSESEDDEGSEQNNMFGLSLLLTMTERLRLKDCVTSLYMILGTIAMAIRGRLTHTLTIKMFRFLNTLFVNSRLPRSKKSLWSMLMRDEKSTMLRHMYCRECKDYLGLGKIPTKECACKMCGPHKHDSHRYLSYFVQVKITPQLRELFSNPVIVKNLEYRFTREKTDPLATDDVCDGTMYQDKCKPGCFLHNKSNFSFTLFTDGVQVTKSSKASAWPIFLQINEFSPQARKRYVILAGIWVDTIEPNLSMFLWPTILELEELYVTGITWISPVDASVTRSKFVTLICTADSVARPKIMNMTMFNGRFGCTYCYAEGVTIRVNGKNTKQIKYPFTSGKEHACRTDQEIRQDMHEALDTNTTVRGVKGLSALSHLSEFDLARGVIVDSMHCVFMGCVKFHTELFLESRYSKKQWYAGKPDQLAIINAKLMNIRFPSIISRRPRKLQDMKQWKASEWRNWVLFIAPTALSGTITDVDLRHFGLLSSVAFILNKGSITPAELQLTRTLIGEYVQKFQTRFGKISMRYNVHLLTHLVDTVERWGPFWGHNAFNFESWNKKIVDKVTAGNSKPLQIVTRYFMTRFIENVFTEPTVGNDIKKMINSILTGDSKKSPYITDHTLVPDKCTGIGKSENRAPTQKENEAFIPAQFRPEIIHFYKRATIHGIDFRCRPQGNERETQFRNSFIYHENDGYGEIEEIAKFVHGGETLWGFFFQPLETVEDTAFGTKHIRVVKFKSAKEFITIGNKPPIPAMVLDKIGDKLYISRVPNYFETD